MRIGADKAPKKARWLVSAGSVKVRWVLAFDEGS